MPFVVAVCCCCCCCCCCCSVDLSCLFLLFACHLERLFLSLVVCQGASCRLSFVKVFLVACCLSFVKVFLVACCLSFVKVFIVACRLSFVKVFLVACCLSLLRRCVTLFLAGREKKFRYLFRYCIHIYFIDIWIFIYLLVFENLSLFFLSC